MKRLKQDIWVYGAIATIVLTSCATPIASEKQQLPPNRQTSLKAIALDKSKVVTGQTIYVPIYSHIYHQNSKDQVMNLSATVSIRNTDLHNSIIITAVRYYDTDGQLVRHYIENPVELSPMASTDFFIEADDASGGSGANFIVEWVAQKPVYDPVVEAVMISTTSAQGISFISPGRVIKRYTKQ